MNKPDEVCSSSPSGSPDIEDHRPTPAWSSFRLRSQTNKALLRYRTDFATALLQSMASSIEVAGTQWYGSGLFDRILYLPSPGAENWPELIDKRNQSHSTTQSCPSHTRNPHVAHHDSSAARRVLNLRIDVIILRLVILPGRAYAKLSSGQQLPSC